MPPPESFFQYTAGRWLHDRERNEALRYQHFNVNALKENIARCTGTSVVVDMTKIGEGRCNKAFRVELSDGRNVVARIPTPLAGPTHLVTASEVATMKFIRNRLGLNQVPRVISWSSNASETPIGAEYIIMDFADGIPLGAVWGILTMDQKILLVYEWYKFERKIIQALRKCGFGSLYFRKDLPADVARDIFLSDSDQPDEEYVLGPSTFQRGYWEDEYGTPKDINFDRGPWPDVPSYLKSLTNCERAWIRKYAKRPTRKYVAPWEKPVHMRIPGEHLRLLDLYDKVAEYFIPTDESLLRPTMMHLDSSGSNMFLSEEALLRGEIEISAVIDWQHTTILPLYLTAYFPAFVRLSTANDGQDEAEFLKEKNYLLKVYHALYFKTGTDFAWASALSFGIPTPVPQKLPLAAQACWHDGYAALRRNLIQVALDWQNAAPGAECPIATEGFTQQDQRRADIDYLVCQDAQRAREEIQEQVGVHPNGAVRHNHYDSAIQTNQKLFEAWKAGLSPDELDSIDPIDVWPIGRENLKRERPVDK